MPATFTFKIDGIQPVISYIDRIINRLDTNIEKTLREAADRVAKDAQSSAPVRTGYLREHIRVVEANANRAVVESQAGYSGFVEYGTQHMGAQPFFQQAVQDVANDLRHRLAESIRR